MILSEVFKALGDETRLRILNLLTLRELCVCQIIEVLKITQPNISKHLNRLRYAGVISCRKIAQWCFYSLNKNFTDNNGILFDFLMDKWQNGEQYEKDRQRLDYLIKNSDCCKEQMRLLK